MKTKFVVVLGALMSGMGKGIVTSSILQILDFYGYNALPIKFDGYLNYDCGTMNPYRHGEVFVLNDKSEVDMDFGIYERFLNKDLTGDLSITGGKLFSGIIEKERKGGFLGDDVQIIPHLTGEILERIKNIANEKKPDVLIIEVGGTVGDIENSYFIEAMRQLSLEEKVTFVALTYLPFIDVVGEQKTKPTQIAFRSIMNTGIRPTFLVCRSDKRVLEKTKEKLSLFTNIKKDYIIDDSTQDTLYRMPLHFIREGFDKKFIDEIGLDGSNLSKKKISELENTIERIVHPTKEINIAIVGKYVGLTDAYTSVKEALIHSGAKLDCKVNIDWVEAEELEKPENDFEILKKYNGVIVPGGFGKRGIEGMINAIKYSRESKTPYLGICLGMQLMAIEYARNVCKLNDSNSTEFNPNVEHKIIYTMPSQRRTQYKGATMRLGAWDCKINKTDSIAYRSYKKDIISERHRHRFEFNNKYRDMMEKNGLVISATTPDNELVEMIEWTDGFGIGTQAHPELKSRLYEPAPLFLSLIENAIAHKYNK